MKRIFAAILFLVAIAAPALGNSIMRAPPFIQSGPPFVEAGCSSGLDYYWAPENTLSLHVDYPYDFLIYGLALYGLYRVIITLWHLWVWRKQ